jgi:hypothetical protein
LEKSKEIEKDSEYTEIEELEDDPIVQDSKSYAQFLEESGKKFQISNPK